MTCKTSYELYHQFPKLAEESGFTFNPHRPRIHIDWNKIRLIDVDSMIRERKFTQIEQHMNDILDCVLESEFDVRILDEGVLKMFRLAQLTVEYQQFCRHYLDRSVYVLRQEISSLAQELNTTKQALHDKENEIKKLRKKTRYTYKAPLPYGHDNIASMILKTLTTRADMLPSTTNVDLHQTNKCKYCDKVFLNQLYLQSHLNRRHTNIVETPEREVENVAPNDSVNNLLSKEILDLKSKLKEMEVSIAETQKANLSNTSVINAEQIVEKITEHTVDNKILTKDAVVSTSNDDYILNKIEEWKREERQKYDTELNYLRNQITETLNLIKQNDGHNKTSERDAKLIEQLQNKVTEQGSEISALKRELNDSKVHMHTEVIDKNKEAEAQISFWSKRAEAQSKQYEALLQKLNEVAKDAKESRALAEAERERAKQLQVLLEQSMLERRKENAENTNKATTIETKNIIQSPTKTIVENRSKTKASPNKVNKLTDHQTLENLHRKAQELLNIGSISSSSSEISSDDKVKTFSKSDEKEITGNKSNNDKKSKSVVKDVPNKIDKQLETTKKSTKINLKRIKQSSPIVKQNSPQKIAPASPLKVIRAKITEEVNSRLISAGVDPLKSRLSRNVFQKQKILLLQEQEMKTKEFADYEKIRHSVLAFLDVNTTTTKQDKQASNHVSVNRSKNRLSTISSVISGVKSKALSLIKHGESNNRAKYNETDAVTPKRALSLLKTPPESPTKYDKTSKPAKATIINKNALNGLKEKTNSRTNNTILTNANSANDTSSSNSDDSSVENIHKHQETNLDKSTKSIENLIKSPAHRPFTANTSLEAASNKNVVNNIPSVHQDSQIIPNDEIKHKVKVKSAIYNNSSSEEIESIPISLQRSVSEQNLQKSKQTKGVLKSAASTSSLNKKKVIFDMDAIQMKSLSASPSQSITEKNESYELGLTNLEDEDWDISSIENELPKTETKIQLNTRTSPKIAELKKTIESQLARRGELPSSNVIGGVDVFGLGISMHRAPSTGGSNTSLGSSILDESDNIPVLNNKTYVSSKINEMYIPEMLNTANNIKNDSF